LRSRIALKKYVKANNKISANDNMFDSLFNRALKSGVEKGVFAQPKGTCLVSIDSDHF
jgi:histone H1/5